MRLLIATDAWRPQVNGVVRTYERVIAEANALGAKIDILSPADFHSVVCPIYPEIRLAWPAPAWAAEKIRGGGYDFIHIATEGPVGLMARRACRQMGRPFTTSYHTRFPEYAEKLAGLPQPLSYWAVRRFHNSGIGTFVATPSLQRDLKARGFKHLMPWTRGVDTELFHPRSVRMFGADNAVFLYAGRISREKNLEAFLSLDLPGRKVLVGDGPHLAELRAAYPGATFTGTLTGDPLAEAFASADVFVFPSRTDTFGLVLLEALASGVPVAGYPVTGPIDIVKQGVTGALSENLGEAALAALKLSREAARTSALPYSWRRTAEIFLANIELAHRKAVRRQALRSRRLMRCALGTAWLPGIMVSHRRA
jgi:glycosyltransferase involved in cell wall biosynthesis